MDQPQHVAAGEIQPASLYTLDEAKRRLGWTNHSLRSARRDGLTVHYAGKRGYVHGSDVIAYIARKPTLKPGCAR